MSFGKALYFPYIHFQDENWLKHSLLYWDGIKRIVPRSFPPNDNDGIRRLVNESLIENVDPTSGSTPYTQGAAAEFIPTIKDLKSRRQGHLGRGTNISTQVAQRGDYALVHVEKMDQKVIRALQKSDLIKEQGDWVSMDADLAGYYLLCLAAHISEKQNAPLLSDSFEMETGGTFFQHSRIKPRVKPQDNDLSFRLARMVLPVPRPENLSGIAMEQIVKFHRQFEAERMQFRTAIEGAAQGAAGLTDPTAIRDFLEEKKKTIATALKDQRKTVEELRVGVVDSLLSVSVPGAVAGTMTGFDPISMAIGAGAGLAVSMISWFTKARGEKRKTIRDCDWHYLLRLEEHFKPKDVYKDGQHWIDQFVYD